jgi:hypothetical protein
VVERFATIQDILSIFGNFTNNGNASLLISALVFTGTTAEALKLIKQQLKGGQE